ncbi:hypothetical protein [Dyadobacter bucti]|nr:hypothetical protein [Dyadobacter bucti]
MKTCPYQEVFADTEVNKIIYFKMGALAGKDSHELRQREMLNADVGRKA